MSELREALSSAFEKEESVNTPEPTSIGEGSKPLSQEPAPSQEPVDPSPIDESPTEPTKSDTSNQPVTPASEEAKIASRVDRAPSSWRGEMKAQWNDLALPIRQEIHRREREFQKYVHESSTARNVYDQMGKILEPHMETFNSAQVNPLGVINELLNQGRTLWNGSPEAKAKQVAQIIADCGVDINILDQVLSSQVKAKQDPTTNHLQDLIQRELAPIKQALGQQTSMADQQRQAREQSELAQLNTELEQFAATHPHFYDVKDDMADLMDLAARRGQALSLEEAYSRASGFNGLQQPVAPPTKPVNLSIGGAPITSAKPNNNTGDLRGTILDAFDNLTI